MADPNQVYLLPDRDVPKRTASHALPIYTPLSKAHVIGIQAPLPLSRSRAITIKVLARARPDGAVISYRIPRVAMEKAVGQARLFTGGGNRQASCCEPLCDEIRYEASRRMADCLSEGELDGNDH